MELRPGFASGPLQHHPDMILMWPRPGWPFKVELLVYTSHQYFHHSTTREVCSRTSPLLSLRASILPLPQVTVACLWAALFNNLLLPWSSRDWALEQISGALTAAADILNNTCQLQFKAAEAAVAAVAGCSGCSCKADLAGALLQQEGALQKRLIEPVVAVQTGGWVGASMWQHTCSACRCSCCGHLCDFRLF